MKLINIVLPPERKDYIDNGIKYSVPNCATSVLLVTDNDKKVIFDTGSYGYAEKLMENLSKLSLSPSDIDYIILSHAHFDHNANLYLFQNAQLVYHKWLVGLKDGRTQKFGEEYDGIPQIDAKGVHIIKTPGHPGHTEDSISVICQYNSKTYAIVGDAIKISIIKKGIIEKSYSNPRKYAENMKKLFQRADVIITGEDGLMTGEKLEEAKKLLKNLKVED